MKRWASIGLIVLFAAVCLAGSSLAKGVSGKVLAVEGDKVTLQLAEGAGANFPTGTRGIDIRSGDVSVRGRVISAKGDKITFRIMRGKASSLAVGAQVELEKAIRSASEEMQGC